MFTIGTVLKCTWCSCVSCNSELNEHLQVGTGHWGGNQPVKSFLNDKFSTHKLKKNSQQILQVEPFSHQKLLHHTSLHPLNPTHPLLKTETNTNIKIKT